MPTFNTDLTVKQPNQLSLGDIMNVARGAQAYQQAQQINPLQVQQQQALTQAQQLALNQSYFTHTASVLGGLLNDPDFTSGNQNKMLEKADAAESYLKTLGVPMTKGGPADQIKDLIKQDPKQGYQALKNLVQSAGGSASQYQSLQATQPTAIYGGQSQGAEQPQGQPSAPTQGVQPNQMNASVYSQPNNLPYPVHKAGTPYAQLPSEENDRAAGNKYKNDLVQGQADITTARENIRNVLKGAQEIQKEAWNEGAGTVGDVTRWLATHAGTEKGIKYQELSKYLANAQITNLRAAGGSMDSDAGKKLQEQANGNITYPPQVLADIARQTDAELYNTDMRANAAQKFAEKFGDQNINAFKQMWTKNADSRIFKVISIAKDPDLSAQQKKEMTDKLLGNDPKERKIFNEKYQNIRKLESTGTL